MESSLRSTKPNTFGQTLGPNLSLLEDPSQAIPTPLQPWGEDTAPAQPPDLLSPAAFTPFSPTGNFQLLFPKEEFQNSSAWLLLFLSSLTCQLNPAGSQTNTETNPVPLTTHPILPQAQETLYSSFQCISKKDVFWLCFSKIFSNPFKIYKVINKINIWKWQYFVATSITFK